MSRYVFPSTTSQSPYQHAIQPGYVTSAHSQSHSPYHSARRNSLGGHPSPYAYTTSQGTAHYSPSHHAHNAAGYLTVPGTSSSHRSRSRSRSTHGHGHTTQSRHAQPHVYTPSTAPVYLDPSHHSTHRYPSTHSHHSHRSRVPRTASFGDRFRRFLGLDGPHHQHYYANGQHRAQADDSGLHRTNTTRSGPWRYVDEHGREVDHLGRVIHRY
ncbi:hypothetical protein EDD16DRAFT_1582029 [Pisolithus croceorrhizus]|nr:hypothetical protein EDD16DRAFT_1582029 [Pisolithus croceorrhizus]